MRIGWTGITIDCADPQRLGAFWSELLRREPGEGALPGWVRLGSRGDGLPVINFQPVAESKRGKNRLHLDLTVEDIDAAIGKVVRLGGATTGQRHDYAEGVVVVMTDPEDNEFCLVQYF